MLLKGRMSYMVSFSASSPSDFIDSICSAPALFIHMYAKVWLKGSACLEIGYRLLIVDLVCSLPDFW